MVTPAQSPNRSGVAQPSWPEHIDPLVASLLVDCRQIDVLEHQDSKAIFDFQSRRIAELVSHVATHSPWWRDRLSGRTGGQVSFRDLPLMTRQEYRASIASAGGALPLPSGHGRAMENATSGSSGVPVEFFGSTLSSRMNTSHYLYDDRRQGRTPDKATAELLGRVEEHEGDHIASRGNPLLGIGVKYGRKVQQATIEEHARWLAKLKPAYFCTAPVILDGLLDTYETGQVAPPQIEQIMSIAETVTPQLRARAKTILGATIRDRYSCEEAGPIAFQCPQSDNHYHMAATNTYVEILDGQGKLCPPGATGRVFVTSLHNFASPVIRYELGDLAAWEATCPCGHSRPILTQMLGRIRFLVRLPSGQRKAVRLMAKDWLEIAPFRETRLVQVSEGVLHAELVLDRPITDDERQAIVSMLRHEISPDLTYEVRQLDRIEWGPSYKRQDVVSLV